MRVPGYWSGIDAERVHEAEDPLCLRSKPAIHRTRMVGIARAQRIHDVESAALTQRFQVPPPREREPEQTVQQDDRRPRAGDQVAAGVSSEGRPPFELLIRPSGFR